MSVSEGSKGGAVGGQTDRQTVLLTTEKITKYLKEPLVQITKAILDIHKITPLIKIHYRNAYHIKSLIYPMN